MRKILRNYQGVFSLHDITRQAEECFPFETPFDGQIETIAECVDALLNKGKKHVILEAPTGSGKTVIVWTIHRTIDRLLGSERLKTTVTTTTKGLQAQYEKETRTYDLKGKTNYMCPLGFEHYGTIGCKTACKQKQCRPKSECPYVTRRLNWCENSYWRCTNSAMFINMCEILCMEATNKADLVVLDECHETPMALLDHMMVAFNPEQLQIVNIFSGGVHKIYTSAVELTQKLQTIFSGKKGSLIEFPEESVETVSTLHYDLCAFLEYIEIKLKEESVDDRISELCTRIILQCQDWTNTCEIILNCGVRDFIVQDLNDKGIILKPVYPADVSDYGIFRKGDYFIHMSATICGLDAYAKILGIPEGDYHTIAMKHPVDVDRRKVTYIPVVKMSGGAPDENKLSKMVKGIDELAETFLSEGKNGLIHTASYKLAEQLMNRSKFKHKMMIGKDRREIMNVLRLNAEQKTGIIVLSPSMTTGYDLKHDLCRWQVIAKVPFGFLGDPLVAYISKKNPGEYIRETVLSVVQASGRVVRGVDDFGQTFVLDESFEGLLSRGKKFFPQWFMDALEAYE